MTTPADSSSPIPGADGGTKCERAKSFMTPCIVRDGKLALSDDGVCVGCGCDATPILRRVGDFVFNTDIPAPLPAEPEASGPDNGLCGYPYGAFPSSKPPCPNPRPCAKHSPAAPRAVETAAPHPTRDTGSDCPCCGKTGALVEEVVSSQWGEAPTVSFRSTFWRCPACGEEWYTPKQSDRHTTELLKATVADLLTSRASLPPAADGDLMKLAIPFLWSVVARWDEGGNADRVEAPIVFARMQGSFINELRAALLAASPKETDCE